MSCDESGGLLKNAINKLPSSDWQAEVFQTMAALRDYTRELTRGRKEDSQSQ